MPLQKSYSEQRTSFNNRKQTWQRSKSHSAVPPQPPKPLPRVSEVTKDKLTKFRFQEQPGDVPQPAETTATNKDGKVPNRQCSRNSSTVITIDSDSDREDGTPKAAKTTNPLALPSYPPDTVTTPVARLAWQDLIQMGEGASARENQREVSPSDRILWDKPIDPEDTFITPAHPGRGRKRARSSSPVSSPAHARFDSPVIDVKQLTNALKSPHADPAFDLWDRFSVCSAVKKTTPNAGNPALAHLIASSSPRPVKGGATLQTESSLRRAISCGNGVNWPKRRKVHTSSIESPTSKLKSGRRPDSKLSMVSALLETVTGEIEKSNASQEYETMPQSPSPSKSRSSPRRSRTQGPKSPITRSPIHSGLGLANLNDENSHKPVDSTSDYGDDDFDDDTLMELDATLVAPETPSGPNPVLAQPIQPPEKAKQTFVEVEDEFGDMDDDLFEAAEGLLTHLESRSTSQHRVEPQPNEVISLPQHSDSDAKQHSAGVQFGDAGSDDFFGDDFGGDFDFEAAELAATQSAQQGAVCNQATRSARASASASALTHPSQKARVIQRYKVTRVDDAVYTTDTGRDCPEKILLLVEDTTKANVTVHLRGDWIETPVSTKAFVHIIGDFEHSGRCIIDNSQNMLILHPDQLISSTVVADSFSCTRRAVLQDRVKATSEASPPLVYGTMLHEIFQEALMANKWSPEFLTALVDKNIGRHIEDLYTIKVSLGEAREHLLSKMREMRSWAEAFVSSFPKSDAIVHGRNGEKANMCVSKLLDVEEHVWSPMYGLKGNIDATVQVTMKDGNHRRNLTVPFEVKTGKNVNSNHQAQTALYSLLLSDRYDIEIVYGILYYMETSQTIRIPAVRHELRHMIMQRNTLACYIRERSVQLPPMKKSKNACGRCYAQTSCFIYHKLADDGDGETSGMQGKFDEVVQHLTPTHKEFFLKWEDLLTKEEKESQKLRRELWTMLSTEREKVGRCFSNVILEEGSAVEDKNSPKINRFQYKFLKDDAPSNFSFMESQLAVGEPIVVSDEDGHFALALGFVVAVTKRRITVAVDRRLHNARIRQPGFDEVNNQVFASIMEVGPDRIGTQPPLGTKEPVIRYRLDKDEFSNGMATVRNNLVQVMANGPSGSGDLRRLVVDLEPPTFKAVATQYEISDGESLNVDQKKAVEKVMSAKDYALVLGMPGTGKTTTIAHIIRALIRQGKSVLLTSYTHSAVDNILLKLKGDSIPVLRLGAPAKVHPEVQEFVTLAAQPMNSFEEIRTAWHDLPVVATTCLGISHPLFNERTFDYCIVDEASQITLPICLGPIRMARTFVLVGDHNQLPPLVQNEEARKEGLDVSLFKLLSDTHPDSVVNLEHQYRMCEDVMALSNELIYEGHLKCGTEELRFRKLDIPFPEALSRHHYDASSFMSLSRSQPMFSLPKSFCTGGNSCWLHHLVDPDTRVAFVNTDALPDSREEAKGNRIVNPVEAQLVVQLVESLMTLGVPANEIGVMTHYRSQLALLKHKLLRGRNAGDAAAVEMHTADRFQGRDKEVVVLSLVRSNEACHIGDLLRDWRRINVAFTRAKTKLLVVGSRETLRGCGADEMLSKFVRLMEDRNWVCDLPADALESHLFEDGGIAATGTTIAPTQASPRRKSPKKTFGANALPKLSSAGVSKVGGKENVPPDRRQPTKKAGIGAKMLTKGKPILRDILNDMAGGGF
ncbi:hypothetical protein PgNI_05644 [Pyricularia grisea]|uniref:DNA replication ATP-dependent helicase/nuclease n=1 Tax=Pyricularia grisea TaxID=148305 RepID=A0A6P8B3R3_PYRGI|nr:hypothetical protein PgNI_05644 [Pyricularia grisea]TLD09942.1 hypothetical protein PgNI_05644 [Pyricularia grisea]